MSPRQYLILYLLLVLSILSACTDKGQKKQQGDILKLEKEVIQIHDEVMPRLSDIARLTSVLEIDASNNQLDSILQSEIAKSMAELNAGDSMMWEWMHNYRKPDNAPLDSILAYLESEKIRVIQVRDVMTEGIKNAEALVQKLNHGKQK